MFKRCWCSQQCKSIIFCLFIQYHLKAVAVPWFRVNHSACHKSWFMVLWVIGRWPALYQDYLSFLLQFALLLNQVLTCSIISGIAHYSPNHCVAHYPTLFFLITFEHWLKKSIISSLCNVCPVFLLFTWFAVMKIVISPRFLSTPWNKL